MVGIGRFFLTEISPVTSGGVDLAQLLAFSARTLENPMARTTAGSRSGIDEYELHDHLSEQLFRAVGGYVANFSSSVSRISQEI